MLCSKTVSLLACASEQEIFSVWNCFSLPFFAIQPGGAQLVAQMFSFLETVRIQGGNAAARLFELLAFNDRSPPETSAGSVG